MPRPPEPDPSVLDASVHLLVPELLTGLVAGDTPPSLLNVVPCDDGIDLGMRPLDGVHPTDYLLGFVAPPVWYALGLATTGTAYDVADRATLAPRASRVHVVTMLTRSGELAHRAHVDGDPERSRALSTPDDELGGEQIDLLRLALELPTPPPPCGAEVYWAIEWLAAILEHGATAWDLVIAHHPSMALRRRLGDPLVQSPSELDFLEFAASFGRVCTWRRLRELVADDVFAVPALTAPEARWLDDGAFARWVLSRCPPLSMLRAQVDDDMPSNVAARIHATLERLGVPAAAWPDREAA
ncbi:MAG: hypothetical protein U5K30_04170 [Acidimicrobiales bacterium]|nr:hypothetical protein [Acidimicrobiales bacterium]